MAIPLIFSCEHATCTIPEAFKETLRHDTDLITSPKGWDLGSLNLAQALAMKFRTPLVHCEISRLIIDCYLQEENPERWSTVSHKLSEAQRDKLHDRQLVPHLTTLRQRITTELERNDSVAHVSVHTFDPSEHPDLHVSLLFSEGKVGESTLALAWQENIRQALPELKVRPNEKFYPDQTKTLLDTFRGEWSSDRYLGLEIQVSNQMFLEGAPLRWDKVKAALIDALHKARL